MRKGISIKMKIFCRQCKNKTNHSVKASYGGNVNVDDNPDLAFAVDIFQIIQCDGCEIVSFREYFETDLDHNPVTGEIEGTEYLYPEFNSSTIVPKAHMMLPHIIDLAYRQTINCMNRGDYLLAGAGLRAIVEGICQVKKVKKGPVEVMNRKTGKIEKKQFRNLEGKINGLIENKYLSFENGETLHELRFLGNIALHELSQASQKDVETAFEIIDHTIYNLFVLPAKRMFLATQMNTRKKSGKTKK